MKAQRSLFALCLLGSSFAVAQTTTGSSSSTTTTSTSSYDNSATTTPSSTTAGTYSTSPSTTGSTYSTGSNNGTYNSTTTPATTSGTYNNGSNMNSYNSSTTTTTTTSEPNRVKQDKPYKAFTGGFYAGVNTTRYRGENVDGDNLRGRLGYQLGVFARGGGRLYGQLGVEYFASSSEFFNPGDGASVNDILGRVNTQWLQIPALIGVKLVESDRGISAIRLGAGLEYANRLGGSNTVNINNSEIRSGTFLGLANLGFDVGPVLIDIVYHHGFSDAIRGFNDSQRRSLGLNVGFKF